VTGGDLIFVGGCMRSGTTLVQRILCSAPASSPLVAECQYLTALMNLHETWEKRYDRFLKDYFETREAFDAFSRNLVDAFLRAAREHFRPASMLVLKNPELTYHFGRLATWYPTARFVVVVRDPRDTIASMDSVARRQRESGVKSVLADSVGDIAKLVGIFKGYYVPILDSANPFGDRMLILRFEDVIRDAPRTSVLLSRFTGLAIDPDGLAAAADGERAYWQNRTDDAYSAAFRSPLWAEPPSKSAIGAHVNRLSAAAVAEIQRRCADFARTFGYW
jgi:hypothetical protein